MRLLNTTTLQLREFIGEAPALDFPKYAILSHTWGPDELTFSDLNHIDQAKSKAGYSKVEQCCKIACNDGLEWAWVDTCCINKDSSAELSEVINSMFKWYQAATVCYAHLEDTEWQNDSLPTTHIWDLCPQRIPRWFGRGWTLQELIAPLNVVFYSRTWSRLGTKTSMCSAISHVTGIPIDVLNHTTPPSSVPVPIRISWASRRVTTRREDMAYCLLGIFDINMPLLYGEGEKAFRRLQEEILRTTDDHGVFLGNLAPEPTPLEVDRNLSCTRQAFTIRRNKSIQYDVYHTRGLLAPSPRGFHARITPGWTDHAGSPWSRPELMKHTLRLRLPITSIPMDEYTWNFDKLLYLGALNYWDKSRDMYLARYFTIDFAPYLDENAPRIYRALSQYSWVDRNIVESWTSQECTIALDSEPDTSIGMLLSKMDGLDYLGGLSPRQPTGWHYSHRVIPENTAIEMVTLRGATIADAAFFAIDCREGLGLFVHFSVGHKRQYRVFCKEVSRLYEDKSSSSWIKIGTRTGPVHEVSSRVQVKGGSAELVATVYCDSRHGRPLCQAEFRFKDYKTFSSSEEGSRPEVLPFEETRFEESNSDDLSTEEGFDGEESSPIAANNGSRGPRRQHVQPTPVVKEPGFF